jgi:hypothetical protein
MTALSFVFAFVLMLGVLIFVHELGHFLVAKLFDVKVLKFSLGFGPAIGIGWRLAFTRGETEYVVAWFRLGGFVKMLGENPRTSAREAPAKRRKACRPPEDTKALRAAADRSPTSARVQQQAGVAALARALRRAGHEPAVAGGDLRAYSPSACRVPSR